MSGPADKPAVPSESPAGPPRQGERGGESGPAGAAGPDGISIRRWFAFYGLYLLAAGVPLAVLLARQGACPAEWLATPAERLAETPAAIKLLAFAIYISLCCTFLPLPANWIVAAVAMKQTAVAPNAFWTTLAVASVGAVASTVANLNDYHLVTWLLRSRRIAHLRRSRLHRLAAGWFSRSPFFLLVLFNVAPIPVDAARLLAASCRYGRVPFAAANFIGRFIRYAAIAFVTYRLAGRGKWAVLALLGLTAVLAAGRVASAVLRRINAMRTNRPGREVSAE
ncbi:MAG: hypothetical protein J7M21_06315 [Planctomycetes bacterium]|nr:hypothetical protein [Planctomycetota bacterium]